MKRTFHFSLRSIFAIVLMAAVVTWIARASIELALIVAAALIGAGWARRPLWPLLGGVAGTVAACAVIATVRHYQYPPIRNSFSAYRILQDRDRELRTLFEVGVCVGILVGYWMAWIKELRHCYRTRMALRRNVVQKVESPVEPTGRRAKFQAALERTNRRYGRALKKLAE